jgi:hypothetical protein
MMDIDRFDALTRSLSDTRSRRGALGTLVGGTFGLLGIASAVAKKGKGKKKPKPKLPLNTFGCVNVGQKCAGKSTNCCSGICQGKKPKKGKRDKSTCIAHNTGGCTPERSLCVTDSPASQCSPEGVCLTTTGNAGFCADADIGFTNCQPCRKDTDCEALGFGAGAACAIFDGPFCASPDEGCAGHNGSSGTACVAPGA